MKAIKFFLLACVFFLFFGNGMAQEIIRTHYLHLGDAPFRQNITKEEGKGFSMYTVATEYLDDAIKNEIKKQNNEGFKSVDKANLLFGAMRTLDSEYPVVVGMKYRVVAISKTQKEIFIIRAVNEDGTLVVPEIQIPGDYRKGILRAQLADFTPSKNENIRLQNYTMSKDSNEYSAVRYLIFKKKAK